MKRTQVNVQTGEIIEIDMTDAEVAQATIDNANELIERERQKKEEALAAVAKIAADPEAIAALKAALS